MKVLGINGSHRKESTTLFFLRKALSVCEKEGLETEVIELWDKEIKPCTVCNVCKTKFECLIQDDMQEIYRKIKSVDAIIIASPVYFSLVSGKLKNLIDRSLPLRRSGFKLRNMVGGAITVGASRNGGQEHVCSQITAWMLHHEMIVVADKETAHYGGIGWVPKGSEPEEDKTGIETCENLGKKICEVLKLIKS